jgi:ABC-type branched-subunit amino acid transport system substrate-binding protein
METEEKETNWSKWGFWLTLVISFIPIPIGTYIQKADNYIASGIAIMFFIVLSIWLVRKRNDIEKKNLKYLAASALALSSLTIGILSLPYFKEKQKTRVAVLLPFSGGKSLTDDGAAQLKGIFKFIGSNNGQEYNNEIEYVFLDHKNEAALAKSLIETEITKRNTCYFFSTMSSVNSKLAEYIMDSKFKNTPILICGVTSFPNIATSQNAVYRYYVRSEDEAPVLAEEAKNDKIEHIIPIIVDDNYGEGSYTAFKNCFQASANSKNIMEEPIKCPNDTQKEDIKNRINAKINLFNENKFGILIAHYGSGIDNIISSLAELGILHRQSPILYVTSTLHSENWSSPIKPILDTIPHHIAIPKYDCPLDRYQEDVEDFSLFAFKKLIESIMLIRKGKVKTFEDAWGSKDIQEIPVELSNENSSVYLKNGDTKIKMKTISNNIPE